MNIEQAKNILFPFRNRLFKSVYDNLTDYEIDAIFVLVPHFEYPDYDYKKVGVILK